MLPPEEQRVTSDVSSSGSHPEPSGDIMQLILAAQAGDEAALGFLMQHCRDYLMLIANEEQDRGLQAKFGASDYVQQTLLAAYENIQQFRGQTAEEFRGWLRQILRNDINRVRRQYVEAERRSVDRERRLDDSTLGTPELVDLAQTPGTDAVLREEARLLKEAMEKLPENYIQVIRLRDWEELSFPEIGRTMNLTEEAARKLWKRAISRLEEILESQMRSHESGAIENNTDAT